MPSKSRSRSRSAALNAASTTATRGRSKSRAASRHRRNLHSKMLSHPIGWAVEWEAATVIPAKSLPKSSSGTNWKLPFRHATLKGGPKFKSKYNAV